MTDKNKEKELFDQDDNQSNSIKGMKIDRLFSSKDTHPFDEVEWKKYTAQITNEKGEVVFEQKDVTMPSFWSQLATNVVVSKYFKGTLGTDDRENSLRQVIERVANTISEWGYQDGYFASREDADIFKQELSSMILHQRFAYNSPVWFNVGIEERPQASACFINSVEDRMESILELAKTEGMLFKFGSGTGSNLSTIRSSYEGMSGGGEASGPVSFMKGYDAFAGVIKSGGKTRRAAKMVILNVDHPDIEDFIECKVREEKKAQALIKQGYDSSFNGEAYSSIFFQNANHSVRVTDDFMRAVVQNDDFETREVVSGKVVESKNASDLMMKIAEAAWKTGDPGIQYDSTINVWHTCPNSGRINASNPCSEYMFLDDSACNLASLNLMKFVGEDGEFDVKAFRHAVRIITSSMEIIVGNASYPTKAIEKNSIDYRPLGLGYTNLGALLMSRGLPYDSNQGRAYAAVITALMHGEAYRTSAEIAEYTGPFKGFTKNRKPFLRVMRKHFDAIERIDRRYVPDYMLDETRETYEQMLDLGEKYGFRNAQATVLAPTGTISFMMDSDTTGIEPDLALIKYKKLVGGGMLKIVNRTVPKALESMGYDENKIKRIVEYIDEHETIEGAPGIKDEHLSVFDCAFKPRKGIRSIQYMGHLRMMEAVQPFLSGAISKTVNMPNNVTSEDIFNTYIAGWRMGLKAIAIYRDGCKADQPMNTSLEDDKAEEIVQGMPEAKIKRRRLPDERISITHKFKVGSHEGYITVGCYEDGKPGEIFIRMSKEGSTVSGLMDSFATLTSIALQYGVPLEVLVRKFIHTRFEPSGYTNNPDIPVAHSVMDYIFHWLSSKFMKNESVEILNSTEDGNSEDQTEGESKSESSNSEDDEEVENPGEVEASKINKSSLVREAEQLLSKVETKGMGSWESQSDAPSCSSCGNIMVRSGACYTCLTCGTTSGCG